MQFSKHLFYVLAAMVFLLSGSNTVLSTTKRKSRARFGAKKKKVGSGVKRKHSESFLSLMQAVEYIEAQQEEQKAKRVKHDDAASATSGASHERSEYATPNALFNGEPILIPAMLNVFEDYGVAPLPCALSEKKKPYEAKKFHDSVHGTCIELSEDMRERVPRGWRLIHLAVAQQGFAECGARAMANLQALINCIEKGKRVRSKKIKKEAGTIFQKINKWCKKTKKVGDCDMHNADWLSSEAIQRCVEENSHDNSKVHITLLNTVTFSPDGEIESFLPGAPHVMVEQTNPNTGEPARNDKGEIHKDPDFVRGFLEELIPALKKGKGYVGGVHNTGYGDSHWIGTLTNAATKTVFVFDSLGEKVPLDQYKCLNAFFENLAQFSWKIVDPWDLEWQEEEVQAP